MHIIIGGVHLNTGCPTETDVIVIARPGIMHKLKYFSCSFIFFFRTRNFPSFFSFFKWLSLFVRQYYLLKKAGTLFEHFDDA